MAVTIWSNSPTYADLKDFGVSFARASVCVVKTGVVINVKYKFSSDGVTWPADGDAVQVGTLAATRPLELVVLSSTEIEIFGGQGVLFRSKKAGETGSWTAG